MKHFYYRALNVISNWLNDVEFTYSDDVSKIRTEAPFKGIVLEGEEPIKVSPGVYLMRGYHVDNKRIVRYNCSVIGKRVVIEPYVS